VSAQTFSSSGVQAGTVVAPRVNLLPPEIAERNSLRRAQLAMVGTGLAAVAVVGVMYTQASAKVSSAQHAKTEAVAENARLTGQLGQLQNVRDTYAQVDVANRSIATAMQYDVHWSQYLQDVTLFIPENVWLNTLTVKVAPPQSGPGSSSGGDAVLDPGLGTVTVTGTALSHDDVATWLESLSREKGFANPYFTSSTERVLGGRVVTDFGSTVNLTEKSLSNTYAKGLER
jgi:Tfp pilus assembly protein PilN